RYSLLMSFGSCSSEITVPPGGPTCRQPCADAATLAANPSAITPNNLPFISMKFSQSADAPTSTSVGNRHFPVACPKGQIRGRLVIVLVRRSQHPFPRGNLFPIPVFLLLGVEPMLPRIGYM